LYLNTILQYIMSNFAVYMFKFPALIPKRCSVFQGEESRYSNQGVFECLQCADGCDACVDASPCVLALNWAMRSAVLGLSLVPVLCLPAVVWFTCRFGHVKVGQPSETFLPARRGFLFDRCGQISPASNYVRARRQENN